MIYNRKHWVDGDLITADSLNNLEFAISNECNWVSPKSLAYNMGVNRNTLYVFMRFDPKDFNGGANILYLNEDITNQLKTKLTTIFSTYSPSSDDVAFRIRFVRSDVDLTNTISYDTTVFHTCSNITMYLNPLFDIVKEVGGDAWLNNGVIFTWSFKGESLDPWSPPLVSPVINSHSIEPTDWKNNRKHGYIEYRLYPNNSLNTLYQFKMINASAEMIAKELDA